MKRLLILGALFLSTLITKAQHEADNWFFGSFNGVSFLSGAPVVISGGVINSLEGCASISTSTGNLLFYTDGINVYNLNNQLMPNGIGLYGGYSSSQSAIIIPDPANSNLFYIFTASQMGGANGVCYSQVDMTLQGGLGNVTVKNSPLISPAHEKITAVKNSSGNGYWVIVHDLDSNSTAYYAYPVTTGGVGAPVISAVGMLNTGIFPWSGCMKVSPDGTKIVNPLSWINKVEIADFNSSTGIVSNPFTFDAGIDNFVYGTAFSQTGNVLYLSTDAQFPLKLFQLNMAAGNTTAILASATIIYTTTDYNGSLQLAPDHKIYLALYDTHYLGVINNPDSLGVSCNYVHLGFYLPNQVRYGLPNSICGDLHLTDIESNSNGERCFEIYPNPFNEELTIRCEKLTGAKAEIKLFDIYGRTVLLQPLITVNSKLQTANLSNGIYLYEICNTNGLIKKGKLVKER